MIISAKNFDGASSHGIHIDGVTVSVTYTLANQTISVTTAAPASAIYGDSLPVAANSTSGLNVAITATGGCSVPGGTTNGGNVKMTSGAAACVVHFNQAGGSGYNPAPEITASVSAQKRPLAVTGITAHDKTYNGSAAATLSGTASFSNIANGDLVIPLGFPTGAFSDKNAAAGKTVSISGISILAPFNSGDYSLVPPMTTADINPATLTYAATPATRAYAAANPSFSGTVSGFISGENQANATTGSLVFASSANASTPVGTADITGSGLTANFGNYSFVQAAGNATALTITQANQTISFAALSGKTYGDADFSLSASATSGLAATFTASGSCSVTGSTAHIVSAGDCMITAHQSGNANYSIAPDVMRTFTVAQKSVAANIAASDKTYDGTQAASATCSIPGKVGTDDVGCSIGAASFADKMAGNGKTVTATGIALIGTTSGNYLLSSDTATASAKISQKDATMTATGISKAYDGTTAGSASLTSADFIGGDAVLATGTAVFASSTVASAVPMHVSAILLSGADAGNYHLVNTETDTTANITQSIGTILLDKTTLSYVYNGMPKSVPVASANPSGLASIVTYDGSTVPPSGAKSYAVFAAILDNDYAGTDNATLVITSAAIGVTASSSTKIFGQPDPAFTYSVTSGQLYGTDSFTGGLSRDPGTDVGTYAIKQGTLSAGGNYTLSYTGANLTITKADQAISFSALSNKVYPGPDFDLSATASSSIPVSFIVADASSTCSVSGITVHLTGVGSCAITAQDAASMNYTAAPDVTQSFDILPADLTAPVITLNGDATTTVKLGSSYADAGATALDNVDGDLTWKLTTTTTVNTAVAGTYAYSYNVSDAAGNAATTTSRVVIVRPLGTDASLSALSLGLGNLQPAFASTTLAYSVVLPFGSTTTPAVNATTTDPNASYLVTNLGGVTGTSTIAVTAEDASTTQAYTISFLLAPNPDTVPPVITILGANPATLPAGATYIDAGATATDTVDGDLTTHIAASSTVNAALAGTYSVVYSVSDAAGNAASSTRTVIVTSSSESSGGSGGGNSDTGAHGSGSRSIVAGAPASGGGSVLGASTGPSICLAYLSSPIRFGSQNDSAQVTLLQRFLNQFEGANLAVTGVYDQPTLAVVMAFQQKYADKILAPWGIKIPTGIVRFTTLKAINELSCGTGTEFPLTQAQLAEIARIKALEAGQGGAPAGTPPAAQQDESSVSGYVSSFGSNDTASGTASTTAPSSNGGFFGGIWSWFTGKK